MNSEILEKRNFLFFVSGHSPKFEDSLIGALKTPSSWEDVLSTIEKARQQDPFAKSIKKVHLYVHVPFCGRICTFCGCSKVLLKKRTDVDDYIKALTDQMMAQSAVYKSMDASSISFGGGTPSLLSVQQFETLFAGIDKAFPTKKRKISFEISPNSWTPSKLALFVARGLDRLSIGVQSMEPHVLKEVSRSQSNKKVIWCIRSAKKAGVPNVNIDLIAGLPGQTIKGLIRDVKTMIKEKANIIHVQPITGMSLKDLCAPGETINEFCKRRDIMMREALQLLRDAGFQHKSPDAYMQPQDAENYMEEAYSRYEAAIVAFGPFSKGQFPGVIFYETQAVRSMADLNTVRSAKYDRDYVMSHFAVLEIMRGLDEKVFLNRFGKTLDDHCGDGLRFLEHLGLVKRDNGVWSFTGTWEFKRVREFHALLRVLFGEKILSRLRLQYGNRYNPQVDYSSGITFLNDFAQNPLIGLYYSRVAKQS